MLILRSYIKLTQKPTESYPNRNRIIIFDFVNDIEINSSWQNLTDAGKMILPKNIYYSDELGKNITFEGRNIISGDELGEPLILRGDSIKIDLGYTYEVLTVDNEKQEITEYNNVFDGYISNVDNRMPIEIHFEDKMWLLKQVQAPNKTYTGTIEEMLTEMLELVPNKPLTMSNFISTKVGNFTTNNETIAQVLERIQRDFRFESFIRNDELRCAYLVYYPQDNTDHVFKFQYNIIDDDLLYKRTDDVRIGIEVKSSQLIEIEGKTNKDGTKKFKTDKLHYFAYYEGLHTERQLKIVPIEDKPTAFDGEIRTINGMKMEKETLIEYVDKEIKRITYDGWRGKFTTFGLPRVKHGDTVEIVDEVIPERTGKFKIKSVRTTFGMNGFRQEVFLDLRVDFLSSEEIERGL
jgi:hypothetical protein